MTHRLSRRDADDERHERSERRRQRESVFIAAETLSSGRPIDVYRKKFETERDERESVAVEETQSSITKDFPIERSFYGRGDCRIQGEDSYG